MHCLWNLAKQCEVCIGQGSSRLMMEAAFNVAWVIISCRIFVHGMVAFPIFVLLLFCI